MSDETNDPQPAPKKKGKGALVKGAIVLTLLSAGGGAAYGLQQAGVVGGGAKEGAKESNVPKLILKGEEDPYAPAPAEGEGAAEVLGEGGSKYRTAYFTFSDEFTSNLRDSAGLIQVSIAASTHRDGRVLMWLKKHELAARSAVLIVLADTPEEEVLTPLGKENLQKRITAAINKVLADAEGFGGVDAVYFRSLLVQ